MSESGELLEESDGAGMHRWNQSTELLAHAIVGYALERVQLPKDPLWGARPATELDGILTDTVTAAGIGGYEALRLFRDVLIPACRPMDDPLNLAYVPTAPTVAATLFDLVVSASSIQGGHWETGAGAVAAENRAIRWLADLAGFPPDAGGCFVSGGSAANLSALVAARHRAATDRPSQRWAFAATSEVHASAKVAGRVMDVDVVIVPTDDRGRMTGEALETAIAGRTDLFAVVASAGTTNAGAVDDIAAIAEVCGRRRLWLHVDGAYGGAALVAPSARPRFAGIEHADSFSVDPHKWLFTPYDAAALVYRDPAAARAAFSQSGEYLDEVDRDAPNPSDLAFHLSRRTRGLPLWFSLATHGTDAYRAAVERTLEVARGFARAIARHPRFELVLEPDLSVVLFRRLDWTDQHYRRWSAERAASGTALIVPTTWRGEMCFRVCIVNPRTELDDLIALLEDMAEPLSAPRPR
jgi:glutamate/tyrosine decarboxylase-like PLP-dependent enzyme